MFERPSRETTGSHSSIVSPPQKSSKTVDLMSPLTGSPSPSANVAAFVALTINGGAYAAEILRGGVLSVDRGQREAGRALGLSPLQVFRYIILKPAMRATYPALTSQFVLLMLTSSIVASIAARRSSSEPMSLMAT